MDDLNFNDSLYKTESYIIYSRTGTKVDGVTPTLESTSVLPSDVVSSSPTDKTSWVPNLFKVTGLNRIRTSYSSGGHGTFTRSLTDSSSFSFVKYEGQLTGRLALSLLGGIPNLMEYQSQAERAAQKAMSKVGQMSLQIPVEFGEMAETIQMLKNPFKNLRKFLLSDKEKNLRILKALLSNSKRSKRWASVTMLKETGKTVSSTWLEFRYGLMPLVMSLKEVMDEIQRADKELNMTSILTCKSSSTDEVKDVSSSPTSWQYANFLRTIDTTRTVTVRGAVYYRNKYDAGNAKRWGLTPNFIPEVAWELTRLSFVVDWLLSVGPWLGSKRYTPELEILGSTASIRQHYAKTIKVSLVSEPWRSYKFSAVCDPLSQTSDGYNRWINPDIEYPRFRYADGLSIKKAIDAVTLLYSPLAKRIRS